MAIKPDQQATIRRLPAARNVLRRRNATVPSEPHWRSVVPATTVRDNGIEGGKVMKRLILVGTLLGLIVLPAVSAAAQGTTRPPEAVTVSITGPGNGPYHFPARFAVRSHGTVTWNNVSGQGHTISKVEFADIPQGRSCPDCNVIFAAHFPNGPNKPPVIQLDDGKPKSGSGLLTFDMAAEPNHAGDSTLIGGPQQPPALRSMTVRVMAPAGSVIFYFCALHPYMHGTITVG